MSHLLRKRSAALLLTILAGGALGSCSEPSIAPDEPQPALSSGVLGNYELGGDFALTDQDGGQFSLDRLAGRTGLLFFGFTECPDACPTTLSKLVRVHQKLGEPENLLTVLVSVDPETDSPEVLRSYLERFPAPAVGLTGEREALESVALAYGASFQPTVPAEHAGHGDGHGDGHGVTRKIAHSLYVYLLDGEGNVRALFAPDVTAETIADTVRQLWEESA